ncbi:class I SAM-dependent methyltransferase [soil metagenome]
MSLTSFSASLDGSLKDVELRGSLAGPGTLGTMPDIDFDALYRGESPGPGLPPVANPPWDTRAPKESVVAWQNDGVIRGDVLDIGCGFGDNAVFLGRHGHRVTGVDISPTAVVAAQRRAHDAGLPDAAVTFAVGDATDLAGYDEAFDTVIDSGMYHCLDDDGRQRYAAGAYRAARPGASLLLCCFTETHSAGPRWRRPGVSEHSLRDTFGGAGWLVRSIRPFNVPRDDGVVMSFWLVHAGRLDASG